MKVTPERARHGAYLLIIGGPLFLLLIMIVFMSGAQTRTADAVAERNTLGLTKDDDIARLVDVIKKQNEQLVAKGVPPEPLPPIAPPATPLQGAAEPPADGQPGRDGQDGRDGLPGKNSTLPGPSGKPGAPGKDSTVPGPRGESGAPGSDSTAQGPAGQDATGQPGVDGLPGLPGKDSTVPGPKGDPGADSTVPGPKGDDGERGPSGRGIEDTECVDGRWQIDYDDGTTDDDAGPCAPAPAPTETVTVTPEPTPTE